jgi:hypothetical protein
MSRSRKMVAWLLRGLAVLAMLVVAALVIAPQLIDLETVRSGIREMFAQETDGKINYQRIELAYFPRPHIVVHKTEISRSDTFTAKIHLLKIYPKIWPLLSGRIQPAIAHLDDADFFLSLPRIGEKTIPAEKTKSLDEAVKGIIQAFRDLPGFKLPELTVRIENSKVNLTDPFGYTFKLRELKGSYQYHRQEVDISFECKSNLWDKVNISAVLNSSDFSGRGHIQCTEFRPQALFSYLFPRSAIHVIETKADFHIDLASDEFGQVQAQFKGAVPRLEMRKGDERLVIEGKHIEGSIRIDAQSASIVLADMRFDQPKMSVSGEIAFDQAREELELKIDADQIDVDSTREMAIKLAGEIATVSEIFNVIRGGTVPWMTVRAKGRTFNELGKLENIVIQGQMHAGKIFIPKARLDLEHVEGTADISKGILRGENLSARMGGSIGQMGTLALGLTAVGNPLDLTIQVAADLSQLIPVLKRLVKQPAFLTELDCIEDFKGSAQGTLALNNAGKGLRPRVEVSEVHLTARYRRLPYGIQIDGGGFFYEGSQLTFQNMDTVIGMSSIASLSAGIDWKNTPTLQAGFKSANLNLAEFSAWLMSFKTLRERVHGFKSGQGNVSFQHLNLEGPLFQPEYWRAETQATFENIVLGFNSQPEPLKIAQGRFSWQGTRIQFSDMEATLGRSSAAQVSGSFIWETQSKFEAQAGPVRLDLEDLSPWLLSLDPFSETFRSYQPLQGSLAFQRMALSAPISEKSNQSLRLEADIETLAIRSERLPGPLQIHRGGLGWEHTRLTLKDIDVELGNSRISQLSVDMDWGSDSFLEVRSASMQLYPAELYPWLLAFEKWPPVMREFSASGGILGLNDLNLKGAIHRPSDWEYRLTGQMEDLVLTSDLFGGPVVVSRGTFDIRKQITAGEAESKIKLSPTRIVWGGKRMTILGEINAAAKHIFLNLNITADGIDWSQVKSVLDYIEKKKSAPTREPWEQYLEGTLNVQADSFIYDTYRLAPLEAVVFFNSGDVRIAVENATICGLSFQGQINTNGELLEVYAVPAAVDQDLAETLACFSTEKNLATGRYAFNGELAAKTKPEAFARSLNGDVVFAAENGRIHRFGILAKIFAILNVTEVYRGEIPDLTGEGFAYSSMKVQAKIEEGKIILQECAIDGASMGIACEGDIDIADKELNLIILVAPFKTADRIVAKIPLIGRVLGGKLISIPFSARGDLRDPLVMPLPPTAVGSGVLGILERMLKLPLAIIEPMLPQINDGDGE